MSPKNFKIINTAEFNRIFINCYNRIIINTIYNRHIEKQSKKLI
jgi:hypothetical protein